MATERVVRVGGPEPSLTVIAPFNIATTALPFTAEQLITELVAFAPAPPAPPEDAPPRQ
jgi:hypothetical protein